MPSPSVEDRCGRRQKKIVAVAAGRRSLLPPPGEDRCKRQQEKIVATAARKRLLPPKPGEDRCRRCQEKIVAAAAMAKPKRTLVSFPNKPIAPFQNLKYTVLI